MRQQRGDKNRRVTGRGTRSAKVAPALRAPPDTYIRPCNQIVRALIQRFDDGVFTDKVGKVDTECVFNQVEYGLASTRVPAQVDV